MFFKKSKKIENPQVVKEKKLLAEVLFWKKEWAKLKKELSLNVSKLSTEELKKRLKFASAKREESEKNLYMIEHGLYLGIGYALNNDSNPEATVVRAEWDNLNNHLGVRGTTRVGKTVVMLGHIEQCIAKGYDCIIIDPKGGINQEVLSSVAESSFKYKRAEELTYFSPAFPAVSQRLNPLYGLENIEVAAIIVESIKTAQMDSFYIEVADSILMAICTSFEYLQEISDPTGLITLFLEEEEVIKYQKFVNNADLENGINNEGETTKVDINMIEAFHRNFEENNKIEVFAENGFNRTLITFRELANNCRYDALQTLLSLVEELDYNPDFEYKKNMAVLRDEAKLLLKSAIDSDSSYFAKVSKNLSNMLNKLSVGPIGELLCSTRINPLMNRLLRKDKGIISVIQPFPMKFKRASTVFNKMILGMLNAILGSVGAEGIALPRKIMIFIDESGTIMYEGVEDFFSRAGGLGAAVSVYTQSDADYKEALGDTLSEVVLGNVNTTITMRQKTLLAAEEAAKDVGSFTQYHTMAMVSSGDGDGKFMTDVEEEYLAKPDDIKKLPVAEGILVHEGRTYYMEFPFRLPPKGSVKMPELKSGKSIRALVDFEKSLELDHAKGKVV